MPPILQDLSFTATSTFDTSHLVERNRQKFERKACSASQRLQLLEIDVRIQLNRHGRHKSITAEERELLQQWDIELNNSG